MTIKARRFIYSFLPTVGNARKLCASVLSLFHFSLRFWETLFEVFLGDGSVRIMTQEVTGFAAARFVFVKAFDRGAA